VRRPLALWLAALLVTLGAAVWQRLSGPTHPVRGTVRVGGAEVRLRLVRSGTTGEALRISVPSRPGVRTGEVAWRRYPTSERWHRQPLAPAAGGLLVAEIPSQPPAGKVEYQVRVGAVDGSAATFPPRPAVARFKGVVHPGVLIPHVLLMFGAMLWSTRAGLGAAAGEAPRPRLVLLTVGLMAVGGLVLGPLVQKAAFGALWTGWPFGHDLTDNKTVVAVVAWAWAAWRQRNGRPARSAVVAAALVTLVVFSIPHSAWGSELRWEEIEPPAVGAP